MTIGGAILETILGYAAIFVAGWIVLGSLRGGWAAVLIVAGIKLLWSTT